jgi:hypothetical protein
MTWLSSFWSSQLQRRKLNMNAESETGQSYYSYKRCKQAVSTLVSTPVNLHRPTQLGIFFWYAMAAASRSMDSSAARMK